MLNLLPTARRDELASVGGYRHSPAVTIRLATAEDATALEVLAALDEAPIPPAPLLLGIVGDELWAAASLSTGATLSDPFRPSAEIVTLVVARGRQLTVPEGPGRGFGLERLRARLPRRDSELATAFPPAPS